jgi:hypothetical protein
VEFEWDHSKAESSLDKHDLPFDEAATASGTRFRSPRDEYDFSTGVRDKYADRFAKASNVVVLDPDVAAEFKTPQAVNDALRAQVEALRRAANGDG